MFYAVGGDSGYELEGCSNGTLGVVLVRHRCSPYRHHGVPDELLDHPAIAGDYGAGDVEVGGEKLPDLFGVLRLRERCEADEIAEQDRDVAQLRRPGTAR